MGKFNITYLLLVSLTVMLFSSCSSVTDERPNVLLIMTDDQGYGDMSCHGNPWLETPNIDALHSQSTRFTDFHVNPSCTPTRAALLTGQNANRTTAWHTVGGRSQLKENTITIANILKDYGYSTSIFGKWHLGDNYPFRPQDRGFDEVLVHGGGGVGQQPDYWDNTYFNDTYYHNGKPEKYEGYCTDVWFSQAQNYIQESIDQKKPFFCYLSTNAPHGPYFVEDKYRSKYQGMEGVVSPEYYGMVDNLDVNLGKLMQYLDDSGIADNTIVIFMTDNGVGNGGGLVLDEWNGWPEKGFNAGMRGSKISEYEGGHRVPFFIRWPDGGVKAGQDIDQLAGHVDVLPTLLDAIGLSANNLDQKIDGISLWDIITGNKEVDRSRILITDSQRLENPKKWKQSATMKDKWRLINGEELYNISNDPGQRNNVAEEFPWIVNELRGEYEAWWEDIKPCFEHYTAIELGTEFEDPTILNTMDLHVDPGYAEVPWHQNHIRSPKEVQGWYAVNFVSEGDYKLTLYRWPPEANIPLNAGVDALPKIPNTSFWGYNKGESVNIKKARVLVGERAFEAVVDGNKDCVELVVSAKSGFEHLRADFISDDEDVFAAFYVEIDKL